MPINVNEHPPPKRTSGNSHLARAAKVKNDEYYTRPKDVERIVKAFSHHLKDKRLYANCDTEESAFVQYLQQHKKEIGYKSLDYSYISYDDPENLEKLDACDVVITNPPFSIYSTYLPTILEHGKDFILIAPQTSIGSSWSFDAFRTGRLFYSLIKITSFDKPDGSTADICCWVISSFEDMDLYSDRVIVPRAKSNAGLPYDNYDAIECPELSLLPSMDKDAVIGVPITILVSPIRKDYEILGRAKHAPIINGKELFKRIFVRYKGRRDENSEE